MGVFLNILRWTLFVGVSLLVGAGCIRAWRTDVSTRWWGLAAAVMIVMATFPFLDHGQTFEFLMLAVFTQLLGRAVRALSSS